VSQRAELRELQGALADCRRQIAALESNHRGAHDLVALLEQEKARADKLQAFVDLLKS
jgi:multidrug resistance efflux pump